MALTVKLVGFREIVASMEQFSDKVNKRAMRNALQEAAEPVAELANALAPADQNILNKSSVVTPGITSSQASDSRKPDADEVRVFVGPSYRKDDPNYAPHAHLVEFGTGPRFTEDDAYRGVMPAQPFLRPAWDAKRLQVVADFGKLLAVQLKLAAERAFARALKGKPPA